MRAAVASLAWHRIRRYPSPCGIPATTIANATAWAVLVCLIAAAFVVVVILGPFGLIVLGLLTLFVCTSFSLREDAPTWGTEVFRARMAKHSSPEQRAAVDEARSSRWRRCGSIAGAGSYCCWPALPALPGSNCTDLAAPPEQRGHPLAMAIAALIVRAPPRRGERRCPRQDTLAPLHRRRRRTPRCSCRSRRSHRYCRRRMSSI